MAPVKKTMTNKLTLRKAERKQSKVRIGMSGPSGSGKTYSALLMARGITTGWDKVVMIDTENGRGDLYSDLGEYDIITLEAPFTPERYIEAIAICEKAGKEVIVIDSSSHEWEGKGGCLESNELLAQTKFRGNSWAAWSVTTPRHQKFIEAIVQSKCHVIVTMRSKTETIQTEDKKIKKVGMKEIQRAGFEYEFTLTFMLDREGHYAVAEKDNTHLFDKKDPFVITTQNGEAIRDWNESGTVDKPTLEQTDKFKQQLLIVGITIEEWEKKKGEKWDDHTEARAANILEMQDQRIKKLELDKIDQSKKAETAKVKKEAEESVKNQPEKEQEEIVKEKTGGKMDEAKSIRAWQLNQIRKSAADIIAAMEDSHIVEFLANYGFNIKSLDDLSYMQAIAANKIIMTFAAGKNDEPAAGKEEQSV